MPPTTPNRVGKIVYLTAAELRELEGYARGGSLSAEIRRAVLEYLDRHRAEE